MSDLDATIRRLRALPRAEQDAIAARIDQLLDGEDLLTPEQWAEIEARLDSNEGFSTHEQVKSALRDRFS
ncbi:MAG: hypothetical protein NW206_05265 [Hyphomonadaceae bacterium]|nr:hypothetical protein [Hyphomonadaceae bacterium]